MPRVQAVLAAAPRGEMRISLQPIGSRGDVEPMVALARHLRARGHEVVFGAPENHRGRIEAAGFQFHAVGVDLQVRFREIRLERASRLRVALVEIRRIMLESARTEIEQSLGASEGADLLIGAGIGIGGFHAAELRRVPHGFVFYAPVWLPSVAHAPVLIPFEGLPRFVNSALWRFTQRQGERMLLKPINSARERLGLPALERMLASTPRRALLAYDPLLGPPPGDMQDVLPSWPAMELAHVGALTDDRPAPLSPELESFLAAGPAPVFVGFGSMADSTPDRTAAMLRALAERLDLRIVWGLGWTLAPHSPLGSRLFPVAEAPFQTLFPRCRLVVHHGGAGTTATALRAGVPQLVVPHIADQFYFGRKVHALRLGPRPVPRRRLTTRRLARAFAELLDSEAEMASTAREARGRLPLDPLAAAVERIEAWGAPA